MGFDLGKCKCIGTIFFLLSVYPAFSSSQEFCLSIQTRMVMNDYQGARKLIAMKSKSTSDPIKACLEGGSLSIQQVKNVPHKLDTLISLQNATQDAKQYWNRFRILMDICFSGL